MNVLLVKTDQFHGAVVGSILGVVHDHHVSAIDGDLLSHLAGKVLQEFDLGLVDVVREL